MKKILSAILLAIITTSASAGDVVGCVYTKTKTGANYRLDLIHPINIYREPDVKSERKQLTEPASYYITERKNGFVKLANPKFLHTNPLYAFSGWAKSSDFDNAPLRNCTMAE